MFLMEELYYPKNVKGISLIAYFALGGIFSIFTVFLMRSYTGYLDIPFLGDLLTAFVEEFSKIFIVFIILSRMRVKHVMTGVLIGFAVGAGFNAFENSQYGVMAFFENFNLSEMYNTLFIRSVYDLFGIGHHYWTAILGGTLVMVNTSTSIRMKSLAHPLFIQSFIMVMLIHAVFNFSSAISIWLSISVAIVSMVVYIRFYSITYRRYYTEDIQSNNCQNTALDKDE
jgi:RsiW-degrading membrane proteinase PrsW (M82 family)